jgi:hypothetical protein
MPSIFALRMPLLTAEQVGNGRALDQFWRRFISTINSGQFGLCSWFIAFVATYSGRA